jgi:hypothetical protein
MRERIERTQLYCDPAVENGLSRRGHPARGPGGQREWRVGYQDDDGGCYLTIFAGPQAEPRARDYFEALKNGRIKTVRASPAQH